MLLVLSQWSERKWITMKIFLVTCFVAAVKCTQPSLTRSQRAWAECRGGLQCVPLSNCGRFCDLIKYTIILCFPLWTHFLLEMVASEVVMLYKCFATRLAGLTATTSRVSAALRRRPWWQSAASHAAGNRTLRTRSMPHSAQTVTMLGLETIPGWPDCSTKVFVFISLTKTI